MRLNLLGGLQLEGTSFSERIPLLVLAYVALEGKLQRQRLADIVWVRQRAAGKRRRSLQEALHRLRRVDASLVELEGEWLSSDLPTDVALFESLDEPEAALALYRGHFLAGVERSKRFELGEELAEWLFNKREALQVRAAALQLRQAEALAFGEHFSAAAELAWQTHGANAGIMYASPELYRRIHTLLLAGGKTAEAATVGGEARDIYGEEDLNFHEHAFRARESLTHTLNQRPRDPDWVNRAAELEALLGLLAADATRFLTIHGPPGVGKTALAQVLAVAARGRPFAAEGVFVAYLEDLAGDAPLEALVAALCASVGLRVADRRATLADLTAFFGDGRILLVLDNVEHLAGSAGELVRGLYAVCKQLRVVLTSRVMLDPATLKRFPLGPLAYPDTTPPTLDEARRIPAFALFERVAARQSLALTEAHLAPVSLICRRVAGLPLAIKLAAAWVAFRTPQAIADELEVLLDETGDGVRTAFDRSLSLLSPAEARSLAFLGVFEHGFTADAAAAVAGVDAQRSRRLLEQSLLTFDLEQGRYSFHPLLGRYVAELFERHEARGEVGRRHAHYFLERLGAVVDREGSALPETARGLTKELGNLARAWRTATLEGWDDQLYVASRALQNFAKLTLNHGFADELLTHSVGRLAAKPSRAQAALTANLAALRFFQGRYRSALDCGKEALALLDQVDIEPERELSIRRLSLGTIRSACSSLAEFERSLAAARQLHDLLRERAPGTVAYANALTDFAVARREILGRDTLQDLEVALGIVELRHPPSVPHTLYARGNGYLEKNDSGRAKLEFERTGAAAQALRLWHWEVCSRLGLAQVALAQADLETAAQVGGALLSDLRSDLRPYLRAQILQVTARLERERPDTGLSYALQALREAESIASVPLMYSVKIDLLGLYRRLGRDTHTLREELAKESARMYHRDRQRLAAVLDQPDASS